MANLKTLGTFAIIIGCFAVIYPRFLHPMFLRLAGMQPKTTTKEEDTMYPPHMRHAPVSGDRRPPPLPTDPKDMRHHMRPGPHPGMRAAAEMQKQQSQGSGRGMMGIVLPMYAIGICVYLVYTLFKVFNKKGSQPDPYTSKTHYESEQSRLDRLGFPSSLRGDSSDQDEVQRFLTQKQQQRDLEDLLVKMDDTKNVPEDEMRALQKRLEETEAQMTRILQAMQAMQAQASAVAASEGADLNTGASDKATEGSVETVGPSSDDEKDCVKGSQNSHSAGSSPDTESYEIVKNSVTDASPSSETSSSSPFQQVDDNLSAGEDKSEKAAEVAEEDCGEDIVMESKEDEEDCSGVRHRKSAHAEES